MSEGKDKGVTRRIFLVEAVLAAAAMLLGRCKYLISEQSNALAQEATATYSAYLPFVSKDQPTPTPSPAPTDTPAPTNTPAPSSTPGPVSQSVVHTYASGATNWDFGSDYYGNYVDQDAVNAMVDRGVRELTGASTVAGAWGALIPDYAPGKAIAIKVNFNNAGSQCGSVDLDIDALIHPINAIVRGVKQIGVAEEDIWVYDATRPIPDEFADGCLYPGVQYFASRCRTQATFNSDDPNAFVHFSPPEGSLVSQRIADVPINAAYLINIPILKKHGGAGVTLAFKNHLGTIENPNCLHPYLNGSPTYDPMVEIHSNPHIRYKTKLIIGDGLFGNRRDNTSKPEPWTTFGGAPNSLLFAMDSVAIDCVMCDLLDAELGIPASADNYLQAAEAAGLGLYERGDPWGAGYGEIDYRYIEL